MPVAHKSVEELELLSSVYLGHSAESGLAE